MNRPMPIVFVSEGWQKSAFACTSAGADNAQNHASRMGKTMFDCATHSDEAAQNQWMLVGLMDIDQHFIRPADPQTQQYMAKVVGLAKTVLGVFGLISPIEVLFAEIWFLHSGSRKSGATRNPKLSVGSADKASQSMVSMDNAGRSMSSCRPSFVSLCGEPFAGIAVRRRHLEPWPNLQNCNAAMAKIGPLQNVSLPKMCV